MRIIAVIDDQFETVRAIIQTLNDQLELTGINEGLEEVDRWVAKHFQPLQEKGDYQMLISQENIFVILLDQRLSERVPVDYNGTELAVFLRQTYKDLPIYGLTAHDDDVYSHEWDAFDGVYKKVEFAENAEKYLKIFIRAATSFLETSQNELAELSRLSIKIASGEIVDADLMRASAIQQHLEIQIEPQDVATRRKWLENYRENIREYEDLIVEIEAYLSH